MCRISAETNDKKFLNRFQYVFENAREDPKAPTYFFGLFRGYLAVDTGQPIHYKVLMPEQSKLIELSSLNIILFQWLAIINCAVIYNIIFVIGRAVFWELVRL